MKYNDYKISVTIDLSREEEMLLIKRKMKGDIKARNKLITSHMPLVKSIVRMYNNYRLSDDFEAQGYYGLIKAADNMDDRGVRFMTYAKWWIHRYILEFLKNDSTIHIPKNIEDDGLNKHNEFVLIRFFIEEAPGIDIQNFIKELREYLTEMEQFVLDGRLAGQTYTEIGQVFDTSRQRVQQIMKTVINKGRSLKDGKMWKRM